MARHFAVCVQCSRGFWRQRQTKLTCSDACRARKSRKLDPRPYWSVDTVEQRYIDFLSDGTIEQPNLVRRLKQIRDKYGKNAMYMTIDCLIMVAEGTR